MIRGIISSTSNSNACFMTSTLYFVTIGGLCAKVVHSHVTTYVSVIAQTLLIARRCYRDR